MRRDLLIGVIATVAFLVAGVVAVVALVTRHRGDIPFDVETAPIVAALVSADGREVTVSATSPGGCRTAKLTARESGRTVELTFTTQPYYGVCQLGGGTSEPAAGRVVLAHPLAGRTLLDHTSGKPVRYFDGRALWRVDYLPPGWRFEADYLHTYSSSDPLTWVRQYASAQSVMDVVQSDRPLVDHDHSRPVATVRVAGRPVPLRYSSGAYTARWSSGTMYFALDVEPTGRGEAAMSTASVERVLSGLHH